MRIDLPDSVRPWKKSTTLNGQELRILGLAAMGYPDTRISSELGISRPALAAIWRRIHGKFGAPNRNDVLARYADGLKTSQEKSLDVQKATVTVGAPNLLSLGTLEQAQRKLLAAIADASMSYINGRQNVRQVYSRMLDDVLALTESHYGLIAEVRQENGVAYLGEYALTCSGWDAAAQAKYEGNRSDEMLFQNIDPLFSEPARTLGLVINNDAATEPERGITPDGHPKVLTFIGIPIYSGLELVGVIGLANRREGYHAETAEFLRPLLSTCANITVAWRLEKARRKMQQELDVASSLMKHLVTRSTSGTLFENADRRVEFINERYANLFGIEATPDQVIGMNGSLFVQHCKTLVADPVQFLNRVENLVEGQESSYGEPVKLADGRFLERDFVVVRSGSVVCGYFWHYREM
jgi:DNA-binding CsgD family transcriptional regulator